jgi:uncharacterized membrane protein YtjA (UPF0391 family)
MLAVALVLFIIAIFAGILNVTDSTLLSPLVTQISFFISLGLSIVTFIIEIVRKPPKI